MSNRPCLFIGSSAEGLPIAEALQQNLEFTCDTLIWSQGPFGLGGGTLESLADTIEKLDFAVLILTADDMTRSRSKQKASPRDNVIFELGFFMGALGRKRTFMVYNREDDVKLPSDLAGITPATYQLQPNGTLQAALGPACTSIKNAMTAQGLRMRGSKEPAITQHSQYQVISDLLSIEARQFFIVMHEAGLALPYPNEWDGGVMYEYETDQRSAGKGYFSVKDLCTKLADAELLQLDLRGNVSMTARGFGFAKWLNEKGKKAKYFKCPFGQWGKPSNVLDLVQPSRQKADTQPVDTSVHDREPNATS